MHGASTLDELETDLGERLRAYRLTKNIEQTTLAERAGVGITALRNLENGRGSTVKTLLLVVRALGREEWLHHVAPIATVNPLTLTQQAQPRSRARARRGAAQQGPKA